MEVMADLTYVNCAAIPSKHEVCASLRWWPTRFKADFSHAGRTGPGLWVNGAAGLGKGRRGGYQRALVVRREADRQRRFRSPLRAWQSEPASVQTTMTSRSGHLPGQNWRWRKQFIRHNEFERQNLAHERATAARDVGTVGREREDLRVEPVEELVDME